MWHVVRWPASAGPGATTPPAAAQPGSDVLPTAHALCSSFGLAPSRLINPVQDPRPETLVRKRRHQRTKMLHQRPTIGLILQKDLLRVFKRRELRYKPRRWTAGLRGQC